MKSFPFLLLVFVMITIGCHRKMHTGTSTTSTPATTNKTTKTPTPTEPVKPLLDSAEAAGTVTPTEPTVLPKPIIIVDAHGNFAVSEKDLPPDASKVILSNSNARAYTPAELKTLSVRYKQIPPRILYVPTALQKTNSRGTYYVFAKKYYYWQKSNGYFYLDENYYK